MKGRPRTILEIGSNTGAFIEHVLRRHGVVATSMKRNRELAEHQRTRGIRCVGSFDDPAEDEQFDVIVLMDVLEHVPDCTEMLREVRRRLSPQGVIFLQFPNADSRAARWAGERWNWWEAPDHVHPFTSTAMSHLANVAGLQVLDQRTVSPLLDDLEAFTGGSFVLAPLRRLNRYVAVNRLVTQGLHTNGSLLQVLLSAT